MRWAIQVLDYPRQGARAWCFGSSAHIKGLDGIFGTPRVYVDINKASHDRDVLRAYDGNEQRTYLIVEYHG